MGWLWSCLFQLLMAGILPANGCGGGSKADESDSFVLQLLSATGPAFTAIEQCGENYCPIYFQFCLEANLSSV